MSGLLKDTSPIVAEILEGKHDDVLPHIHRAAALRMKRTAAASGVRRNSKIRIKDVAEEWRPDLVGRTGIVERVNQKTYTVKLDQLNDGDYDIYFRFPHSWIEAVK